jgi:dolichyl-phosphate beta-glucosyltransferase
MTIVVPCYNEAQRLPVAHFRTFIATHPEARFLFVNDGSTDATRAVLDALVAQDSTHFSVIDMAANQGKAEAVRTGMLQALRSGTRYAGYWDADLAAPLTELPRFVAALESHPEYNICFGSRVRLLGRAIDRHAARHYLGRLFATAASFVLDLPVYDTQCGAQLVRHPLLRQLDLRRRDHRARASHACTRARSQRQHDLRVALERVARRRRIESARD